MACGEEGEGRMAEVADILAAVTAHFAMPGPLAGKRALVTSGPTYEPLDPVRFLGNRSSGKQGHAIAAALALRGADTTLVTGPVALPDIPGVKCVHVETAQEMMAACAAALPCDVAVCAAAVADWRAAEMSSGKLKKGTEAPRLDLVENPDILAALSQAGNRRPRLVAGFAAETDNIRENAAQKLQRKGCDWLFANQVGAGQGFGTDDNEVVWLRRDGSFGTWPRQSKADVARRLADEVVAFFGGNP
jgi:phosphopantothenoylcysteine decarboxylase/phosphopantothenate--cysteine ligase